MLLATCPPGFMNCHLINTQIRYSTRLKTKELEDVDVVPSRYTAMK